MSIRPGFDVLKWCFLLLGAILLSQIAVTLAGSAVCFIYFATGRLEVGACSGFLTQSREIWAEALAVVLALLLAARSEPPRPPDPPGPPAAGPQQGPDGGGFPVEIMPEIMPGGCWSVPD